MRIYYCKTGWGYGVLDDSKRLLTHAASKKFKTGNTVKLISKK